MKRPLNRDADRMRRHNRLMKSYRTSADRRQLKRAQRLRADVYRATVRRLGEQLTRNSGKFNVAMAAAATAMADFAGAVAKALAEGRTDFSHIPDPASVQIARMMNADAVENMNTQAKVYIASYPLMPPRP